MPRVYNDALRALVLEKVDEGRPLKEVSRTFKVSENTFYLWRKQREKTGSFSAKTGYQVGHGHKITDLEAFKAFVDENPHRTLDEMARDWGGISRSTIRRYLKKIGRR